MSINTQIFEQFPILETERLLLRDIRLQDAPQIFEMRASGKVNQFIPRKAMQSEQESVLLIEKTLLAYQNRQGIGWAGVLKSSPDKIIGTCGFNRIEYDKLLAEIGGEMAVEFWQNKLATEAVQAIIDFGFSTMGLKTIEAKVNPENLAAIGVLTKFGFQRDSEFSYLLYC